MSKRGEIAYRIRQVMYEHGIPEDEWGFSVKDLEAFLNDRTRDWVSVKDADHPPQDGQEAIVLHYKGMSIATYDSYAGAWEAKNKRLNFVRTASHWMPLPEKPL